MTIGFLSDLRWNNIGLLGGRALVNCLPSNRTLWRLDLAGNNIPSDILRAVGMGTQLKVWSKAWSPFTEAHPPREEGGLGLGTGKVITGVASLS